MANKKLVAALLLSVLALNACAAPIIAAGAAGGTAGVAASREGGLGQAYTDSEISTGVHDAWFNSDRSMFDKLYYTVFEGRVLIVGSVQQADYRDAAIRMAWQVPGVRQVINEIRVEPSNGITGYTKDAWIGAQLKTRLLTDRDIASRNYKYECNGGVIYLIGTARDQEELNLVLNHARNIAYVKDVVSYVRLNGNDRPNEGSNVQNSAPEAPMPVTQGANASTVPAASSGYGSSSGAVTDSDSAVGSSYTPPPVAGDISSTDLPPVK